MLVRIPLKLDVLNTTLCDKVCQWLAAGRWFSPGTPVSSNNKTDCHDITAILLKVALNITILNRLVLQATKFILGFFSSLNLMISVNHFLFLFFCVFLPLFYCPTMRQAWCAKYRWFLCVLFGHNTDINNIVLTNLWC